MKGRNIRSLLCEFLQVESRIVPATLATFQISLLSITGDSAANNILVSADTNGNLVVTDNGVAVAVRSSFGAATRANTTPITVEGRDGDDVIVLDRSLNTLDASGKLAFAPDAVLDGGGNDTITGGAGSELIDGGNGDDTLDGGRGYNFLTGGAGMDRFRATSRDTICDFNAGEGDLLI